VADFLCRGLIPNTGEKHDNQMIKVTVTTDVGPAARQPFEAVVTVPDKSTVLEVLLSWLPVTTTPQFGMDHFVGEIDGVKK
jgi:hypothetical protein